MKEFLESRGYKCYPQVADWPMIKNNTWQKLLDNERVCNTNDKLYINVRETQFEGYDKNYPETYTVEIVAEYNGLWWTLNCYSLHEEQLKERYNEIVETLIDLFNTI